MNCINNKEKHVKHLFFNPCCRPNEILLPNLIFKYGNKNINNTNNYDNNNNNNNNNNLIIMPNNKGIPIKVMKAHGDVEARVHTFRAIDLGQWCQPAARVPLVARVCSLSGTHKVTI